MGKAVKQNTYYVDTKNDTINFNIKRGDTITDGENGIEYILTTLKNVNGSTLKQLIAGKSVMTNDNGKKIIDLENQISELISRIVILETKPKTKTKTKSTKTNIIKDA